MKIEQIKLYGSIEGYGENSAAEFGNRLSAAEQIADEIHLHIHSPGGNCFEGNMIYNLVAQCKRPVHVYVDGMAASMASIIMLAGKKIYMAENAFVMIHCPSSCIYGGADDMEKQAKLLRKLEGLFVKAYSQRTGKDEKEVAAWMLGDNWFDAKEALAEKLIDGITSVSDIETLITPEEIKTTSASALWERFSAVAKININPQIENQMNKQSLIDKFGLTGVTAESPDEAIEAALADKMSETRDQLEEVREKQVTSMINAAIAAKKISEEQRDVYVEIAKTNGVDMLEKVFASMHAPVSVTKRLNESAASSNALGRESWTWDDWQERDPKGLEAMAVSDKEAFDALYNKKYN